MLDIKWVRENVEEFTKLLARRGIYDVADKIVALDHEYRQSTTLIQQLQHARKEKSREMSLVKSKTSTEFQSLRRDAEHINDKIKELASKGDVEEELYKLLDNVPNLLDIDVPDGADESSNKIIKSEGKIKDLVHPKSHDELGEELGILEFRQTVKMSGSRFVTLFGDLARLERALVNFMLDINTKQFGFTEVSPPYLVRPHSMYNAGQLPKFAEDSFLTTTDYRLIPTAEVPLINMVADTIIAREKLPMRLTAYTPCFRSEAGSAGRDTRGMIRMHQFSKVELVSITTPEESKEEHEYILSVPEEILRRLDLPYRVMLLCSGDTGFASTKTYDVEVWLPAQQKYRELSSCSNCGDFQARRMKTRYKEFGDDQTTFVHTLNGSALPIGRTLVAILENYQNPDGSISIPEVLQSYMGGVDRIEKNEI